MDADRWRRVEAILDRALDADEAERGTVVAEACGGDVALRTEVERLLASCESAGPLFEEPPRLVAEDLFTTGGGEARDQLPPGSIVGAYRIVRLLGRGGMGAVYLAERADGEFEKSVALKVVKRGMDTDEILGRFRHERQILARLEHPNIAGLLDGGITTDGLPFFVMELAEGEPIDSYCDARRLTIERRLALFRTVCEAVQYAHRNLVVHRDLKPSNILVADGEVKLLDFGIAKVLDPEAYGTEAPETRLYGARLTPEYASPEQVRGQPATTATDVYSLGVILYGLLTGRLPYRLDGRSFLELERVVCHTVPLAPSAVVARAMPVTGDVAAAPDVAALRSTRPQALRQKLAGDLDAITLMALQKEAERRYTSAARLSDDLGRFLDGQPVLARPDTRRYRIVKFIRRNRKTVGLAAAAVIALMAGTAGTTWQWYEAQKASAQSEREAESARSARDYTVRVMSMFDPDILGGKRTFTLNDLMQRGLHALDSLDAQPATRGAAMNALGQIAFNNGERTQADSLFRAAYAALAPLGPSPELAVSMVGIGEVLRSVVAFDSAAVWFRRAVAVRTAVLPPRDPRIAESRYALAFALYNLGTDRAEDSSQEAAHRQAVLESERLYLQLLELPGEREARIRGRAMEGLADLRLFQAQSARDPAEFRARAAEARSLYRGSIRTRMVPRGAGAIEPPENGRARWGLAFALQLEDSLAAAEQTLRDALRILRLNYPTDHPDVAWAFYNLGQFLAETGRPRAAEPLLDTAATMSSRISAPGHLMTGDAYALLGRNRLALDEPDAAADALGAALDVFAGAREEATGREEELEARIANAEWWLGHALLRGDTYAAAEPHLRAGFQSWQSTDPRAAANAADSLAVFYRAWGKPDSAAVYEKRAAALARRPGST